MSGKHVSLVLKSGKLKGNALLMAVVIARKAWTGTRCKALGRRRNEDLDFGFPL